jgi:starvation-inducible DNA-binding protein
VSGSDFKSPLTADLASRVAAILQPIVFDLLDLSLQLKHVHWNLRGALFMPLHAQLDTIHATVSEAADGVAERQVMLGHPVDGQSASVAARSHLNALHVRFLPSQEVIEDMSNRLLRVIVLVRDGVHATGDLDPVTQDLLIGVAAGLEKHLWMLQAQQL